MDPLSGSDGLLDQAFQVCYVAADRESGVRALSDTLGLSDWIEFDAQLDLDRHHEPRTAEVAVAFARWGRVVVEVLEPLSGAVEIFRPAEDRAGLRMHHVAVRVGDLDAARRRSAAGGMPTVLAGRVAGLVDFAFVDATPRLGHHLELVQFSADGWAQMAGILGQ